MSSQTLLARLGWSNPKPDIAASIVVFLVALPLCMGIAIASGYPPAAGLVTGIVGGLIVGSLSGSPLQVSGPAAGLSVIVWQYLEKYGLEALSVMILIAGALQVISGLLKLGQVFRAVSPAVIQGMLSGIGVLIFASQFHVMLDDAPKSSGIANLIAIPQAVYNEFFGLHSPTQKTAGLIGLCTITVIVLWQGLASRKMKVIPAPLVGVLIATVLASVFALDINRVTVPENMKDALRFLSWNSLRHVYDPMVLLGAASLAFIASAETLLSAAAVDKMHSGPRAQFDRELVAQGVGNSLCGILGVLPMTGVIVRSGANVQAGAKTRASTILHGSWLLIFVIALPWVLRMVPTACLAGILVFTGYKLVNFRFIKEAAQFGRGEVLVFLATLLTVVGKDLLTGIVVGLVIAIGKLVYMATHLRVRLKETPEENKAVLYLTGAATFLRLPKLAATLDKVRPGTTLVVEMDRLTLVDHACFDMLRSFDERLRKSGGELVLEWGTLSSKLYPYGKAVGRKKLKPISREVDREV